MMIPPQKVVSRPASQGSLAREAGTIEQAGRSTANLHAEREASLLRAADTDATISCLTAVAPMRATQSENDAQSSTKSASATPLSETGQLASRSHSPSPSLKLARSSTNSEGTVESDESNYSRHATSSSSQIAPTGQVPSPQNPFLKPPRQHPLRVQRKSSQDTAGYNARPVGSPLTMQDLGSDYTRYFNPYFAGARSASFEKLASRSVPTSPSTTPMATVYPLNQFLTPNITPTASTTGINILYDAEKNASLIDDRLAAPYYEKGMASWPLITDEAEPDDEMHMPQPDDDLRYRTKVKDHFARENIASTLGLILMLVGLSFVFFGLPILSALGVIDYNSIYQTPLDQMSHYPDPEPWAVVNDRKYPLIQNIRRGLIDADTPKSAMTKKGQFGDEYELVFSDEFNDNNRTFYEGDDPYFFAPDIWYGATKDLEWYDPDAVTTWDGTLELRLDKFVNHGVQFRSGMLNSWNHLCFKGGIFEVSVSLPGPAGIPGMWPGAWTMGNLGRPGYLSTTDGLWPYTYQACDVGITPNQSSYDGLSNLPGQRLSSCTCPGEDHPTPGTGRGAPEIDIIEVGATYPPHNMPIATQSYQVAPFDVWWYPNYNFTAFPDYSMSWYNGYTGGPYQQAISATTNLNKDWFDGQQYQRYSFEYVPGEGKDAYISWQVGDQQMFMLDGRAIGPNGNIQARQISEEPMSLVLNLGISESWTWIDWANLNFPAVMRVDYVRWYQKKGEDKLVTCDPPGFETTKYIKEHINAYTNPNLTVSWRECCVRGLC
jgi:beta-glucanase (GH16 family)